jgi:hypothetical protein
LRTLEADTKKRIALSLIAVVYSNQTHRKKMDKQRPQGGGGDEDLLLNEC